ncbi:MAG: hypothetical protein ACRDHZ_20905, partial [Ktedonobacteraceae bacterium]
ILTLATLYQLIEPLLVLFVFIALLRLRWTLAFTWLDHAVTLGLATICALLDSAYWQAQATPQGATIDQHAANQQFLLLTAQIPAIVIYGLLIGLSCGLIIRAICHFRLQVQPSTALDKWLTRLRTLLILAERLLVLALVAIALILQGFFGPFKNTVVSWLNTQHFTGNATDILALLVIGVLLLLSLLGCAIFARLLAPSRPQMEGTERWAVWLAALACLLLTWQDPQINSLPLLLTGIQLTGNLGHWPMALLSLALVGGLLLTSALARLWLRRGFFTRYRTLMQPVFLLAMLCFLLQLVWPIFLPLGLIIVIVGVLLASQIEKAI